jgi:putative transposase
MPRRLRIHQPGGFYHVTLRGNHQRAIFFAESDRSLLNIIVARSIERFGARLHAYCWMGNHIHMVMQIGAEPLSSPMRQIASEFARAMQIKLETTGNYFERRYHAILVDADSYLMELLRYVHLNPVRAGVVREVSQYPWSSHHAYVGVRSEPWMTTDFCLRMFDRDRKRAVAAYRNFVATDVRDDWDPSCAAIQVTNAPPQDNNIAHIQELPQVVRQRQTLKDLIAEACKRFGIDAIEFESPVRDAYLTKARAWIAHQATQRRVASRSAVARALGRTESTLRHAIRMYPSEVE